MKALVYDGPEQLGFRDVADAVAGPGQHLIKVLSVGVCGSDMHAYLGHDERRPAPLILGHEAAGEIISGPRAGERVTVNPLVSCGSCAACSSGHDNLCAERMIISMPPREGAFAQMIAMCDENLVTVPDHVSLDAACLAEPIACGWHAVRLAKRALADARTALVIGGGAIGLGAALSLAAQGVTEVTILEPNAMRREVLNGACQQTSIAPDDLPADAMFDVVIDGVGYAATRATASAHARPGGVIAHIGLGEAAGGLDIRRMTLQEITFFGTYTYTAQDFRDTAEAIFDGRLGPLDWTEARPLSDGASAFTDIRAGKSAAPKIVLRPHD
ncbi:zinc-dependent alcohol dehydrogenase [Jannaschia sp. CCS1]|uniref:zinc-dependent alcohol dehydrogenase n=1 Tax=Jannaschia sp. (strain CCS1) TaxID=290400 RepID=UPI000053DE5C|nr:alcohol dehydrogenase catalytic domain-containing protein [Jannaschia sp. CCS1]ABD54317.1 Alcohol dehydrogenase GroES-like protein [Jannaschia sp. CCS1]